MAVVDASVWVSLFHTNDKFHDKAKDIIDSVVSTREDIIIPAIAITEVAGVIKRITQDQEAAYRALRDMEFLNPKILFDFGKLEPIATRVAINYN